METVDGKRGRWSVMKLVCAAALLVACRHETATGLVDCLELQAPTAQLERAALATAPSLSEQMEQAQARVDRAEYETGMQTVSLERLLADVRWQDPTQQHDLQVAVDQTRELIGQAALRVDEAKARLAELGTCG